MTSLNTFINISFLTLWHFTTEIDLLLHNLPGVMISGEVGSRWHTIKMSFAAACSIRHLLGAFICTHDVWQLGCLLEIGGSN